MTTRVLASSMALPQSMARPFLHSAKRSLHTTHQLSHAKYPTPFQPFAPHSRGHTRFPSTFRTLSTSTSTPLKSSSSLWTKAAIGGTVALATSATLLNQIAKAPVMMENSSSTLSGNVVADLKDEDNRIGVEKKSNADLMLSMLVYKLCTFSLLVDMAPKLISLAEMMHLTPPVYWFVRNTFFAQFCG